MQDLGCLVVLANKEHVDCDWSPLCGLDVLIFAMSLAADAVVDLAIAISRANPRRLRTWQANTHFSVAFCDIYIAKGAESEFA